MYNGYSVADNITPETGCKKDGIMAWKDGIVTRAVLYDIPQLKGVDWIEPGTPITRADLEAWEKKSGVKAGPGDVLLLYRPPEEKGGERPVSPASSPDIMRTSSRSSRNATWRSSATISISTGLPGPDGVPEQGIPVNPIHQAVLNWMGVSIIENLDLEQAVETARRLKRYEFMLTFAPIPVEGGTGSPINPLAVF